MTSHEFIIPFYGQPRYLHEAIARIRSLDHPDWRLTIVEDVYPDGAAVERDVLALGDDRIRYVRNEENLGVNANVYKCIQLAESDWFTITGYDDMVLPNYLRAVDDLIARHPDAALVQPGVEVVDEESQPHFPLPDRIKRMTRPDAGEVVLQGERAAVSLLRSNWLYTPASCYRAEYFQKAPFRKDIDAAHDLAFIIDVVLAGGKIVVGTETAFQYRRHRTSHSSSFARSGERFLQERKFFLDIRAEMQKAGWHRAEKAARRRLLSRLNALSQVPSAALARDPQAVKTMIRHAVGS